MHIVNIENEDAFAEMFVLNVRGECEMFDELGEKQLVELIPGDLQTRAWSFGPEVTMMPMSWRVMESMYDLLKECPAGTQGFAQKLEAWKTNFQPVYEKLKAAGVDIDLCGMSLDEQELGF